MSGWRAVVPFKGPGARKSRLGPALDADARERIAAKMLVHVLATLAGVPEVTAIELLSPAPRVGFGWHPDRGRGLNEELTAVRASMMTEPLLIVHGDLPDLTPADVSAMLDAASGGVVALAPDRHGQGTNAIALPSNRPFRFYFGPGSLALHIAQGDVALVHTPGLSRDVDTAEDLRAWRCRHAISAKEIVVTGKSLSRPS